MLEPCTVNIYTKEIGDTFSAPPTKIVIDSTTIIPVNHHGISSLILGEYIDVLSKVVLDEERRVPWETKMMIHLLQHSSIKEQDVVKGIISSEGIGMYTHDQIVELYSQMVPSPLGDYYIYPRYEPYFNGNFAYHYCEVYLPYPPPTL